MDHSAKFKVYREFLNTWLAGVKEFEQKMVGKVTACSTYGPSLGVLSKEQVIQYVTYILDSDLDLEIMLSPEDIVVDLDGSKEYIEGDRLTEVTELVLGYFEDRDIEAFMDKVKEISSYSE